MVKQWGNIGSGATAFTVDSTSLQAALAFGEAQTIIRMLGSYVIGPSAAPAATDSCIVSLGIGIVSSDAAAVGATAMPDPGGEARFPWLYWANHNLVYRSTEVDSSSPAGAVRVDFDIKSMRKVKPSESIVFLGQYENISGDPSVFLHTGRVRLLLAIH